MRAPAWESLIIASDMRIIGESIYVTIDAVRGHRVDVVEQGEGWIVTGRSADRETLAAAGIDQSDLWERNRHQRLTGYAVGADGSASVTAWIPFAGTSPNEFQAVVREVATEADRLEYYCHGGDEI